MSEHIDVDVSGVLRRVMTIPPAGDALIEMVVRTADGRHAPPEAPGHREFVMTRLYRSASGWRAVGHQPPPSSRERRGAQYSKGPRRRR
jgi:hypothetical protein